MERAAQLKSYTNGHLRGGSARVNLLETSQLVYTYHMSFVDVQTTFACSCAIPNHNSAVGRTSLVDSQLLCSRSESLSFGMEEELNIYRNLT